MTIPLIEKYRVQSFNEIRGQELAKQDVKVFFNMFPKKRALVLHGPTGIGKTSMAIALAREFNLEIFELNASDLRNKKSLDEILRPSIEQQSLFKKGKLILMDEADGITATDRGGLPELISLIDKTSFPIIITANDIWDKKYSLLRKKCQLVALKELKDREIINIMEEIVIKEHASIRSDTLSIIANHARGDVRAALNDLQSVMTIGENDFILEFSEREKQGSIFNALKKLFQDSPDQDILNVFDSTELELDEILLWVEENIPIGYYGSSLIRAIHSLGLADLFKGRIYRKQYWRFLMYESFFLTAGISVSSKLKQKQYKQYVRPTRVLKIWLSNQKNSHIDTIIQKYSAFCHVSKRKSYKEKYLLPFILSHLDDQSKTNLHIEKSDEEFLREKQTDLMIAYGLNRFKN